MKSVVDVATQHRGKMDDPDELWCLEEVDARDAQKGNAALKTKLRALYLYMRKRHVGHRCHEKWTEMERFKAWQFAH